jgi:uncharacterized protein (DUF4415 family)
MTLATTSKPLPADFPKTPQEWERVIAAAPEVSSADADNPPTTDFDWDDAIVSHSLPELRQKLAERRRGRPVDGEPKTAISLRVPVSVLAAWKASGPGWQTRMVDDLSRHAPA